MFLPTDEVLCVARGRRGSEDAAAVQTYAAHVVYDDNDLARAVLDDSGDLLAEHRVSLDDAREVLQREFA